MKRSPAAAQSVAEYIAGFPPGVRTRLKAMRATIRKAAPDAVERIAYGVPTYSLGGNLVHFGGFARHVGFFPGPSGIAAFRKQLARYESAKGSVRFPHDAPLPLALVAKIVKFRVAQMKRGKASRARKGGSRSKTENKTKPTDASVADYIASRANAQQQADCRALMAMLARVTRQVPRMWGPSIVGYGSFRYTYESGRTGESPLAAFAIRGRDLVVYVDVEAREQQVLLSRLGRHSMGKVCLYFRQLADLDSSVLEQLVVGSITATRQRFPDYA